MKTTKESLFKLFRTLCRQNKIKLEINTKQLKKDSGYYCEGAYFRNKRKIIIRIPKSYKKLSTIAHVFFHEFCHHKCYELMLFPKYHTSDKKLLNPRFLFQALQAERRVDLMARNMYLKLFPRLTKATTIYDNFREGYEAINLRWGDLIEEIKRDADENLKKSLT